MPPPTKKSRGISSHVSETSDFTVSEGDFVNVDRVRSINNFMSSTPAYISASSSSSQSPVPAQRVANDSTITAETWDSTDLDTSQPSTSRKRSFGDSFTITHLEGSRSLFSNNVSVTENSHKGSRFDTNAFTKFESKSKPPLTSAQCSPFYTGRTMYGGASTAAYSNLTKSLFSSIQKQLPTRPAIQIHAIKPSAQESNRNQMSQTARRILDALEDYARPLQGSPKISPNKPALVQNLKRFGEQDRLRNKEERSPALARTPYSRVSNIPFQRELQVATVPELLKMLKTNKLQKSTQAIRKIATNSTSYLNQPTHDYQLRTQESDQNDNKSVSKMKTKVTKTRPSKNCIDEEESAPTLQLPSVPLTITNMPTFDIKLPEKSGTEVSDKTSTMKTAKNDIMNDVKLTPKADNKSTEFKRPDNKSMDNKSMDNKSMDNKSKDNKSKDNKSTGFKWPDNKVTVHKSPDNKSTYNKSPDNSMNSMMFKFSSPIKIDHPKINFIQCNNFKFSDPAKVILENNSSLCKDLPDEDSEQKTKEKLIIPTTNSNATNINFNNNSADKTKDTIVTNQTNKDKNDNDFLQLIKQQNAKWECTECLTRNEIDKTNCVCCEAMKPGSEKPKNCIPPPVSNSFQDILKKQNEKWECDACMTRNDHNVNKCICCETPKPGSNVNKSPKLNNVSNYASPASNVTGSFQDFVKKQNQKWECEGCFTRNDMNKTKCACCEATKPGLSVEKQQFNFSSVPTTEFKFGLDKADAATVKPITFVSINNTTSSATNTTTSKPFTFGMPTAAQSEKDKIITLATSANSSIAEQKTLTPATTSATTIPFTFGMPPKTATNTASTDVKTTNTAKIESSIPNAGQSKPMFQFSAPVNKPTEAKPAVPVTFCIPSSSVSNVTNTSTVVTSQTGSTATNSVFTFGTNSPISSTFNGSGSNVKNDASPNPAKFSIFNAAKPSQSAKAIESPATFAMPIKRNETNTNTDEPLSKKPVFTFNAKAGTDNQFGDNSKKTLETKEIKPNNDKFQFGASNDPNQIKTFSFVPKTAPSSDKAGLFVFGANGSGDSNTAQTPFTFGSGQTATAGFGVNKTNDVFGINQTTVTSGAFPGAVAANAQPVIPAFGSSTASNSTSTGFSFGNSAVPPVQGSAVFTFGNAKPSQEATTTGGFNFSSSALGTPQIPNLNFAAEAKSANLAFNIGTSGSPAAPGGRKIKKAVRRTQR